MDEEVLHTRHPLHQERLGPLPAMSTDDISPDQFATSLEELADSKDLPALRGYDAARRRALTAARRLHQRLETPLELSRRLGWQESAHVVAIKIAMDLGLFKVIQERDLSSNGGTSVRDLAEVSGGDEELVGRVMRHLATFEMVREMDVGLYAATATSDAFLDRKVYSGIDYWVYLSAPGMSYLPRFVREDGYANLSVPGKSNWEKASGTGKPFFAWLNDHPHALKTFTDHLNAFTDGRAGWIDTYPARERLVEGADTDGPLLVDVGGGVGRDVLMFQQRFAQPSGRLFVQDLPEVVSKAEDLDPAIEMQAHDFFSPQALCGARAFLLH